MIASAQEEPAEPQVPPRMIIDTQDASIWKGGSLDTTIVREGIPATIRWDHAKAPSLRATKFPTDWTGPHNAIEFWLHSQSETRSSFMFIVASENPKTDGMDYYQKKISLEEEIFYLPSSISSLILQRTNYFLKYTSKDYCQQK